LIIHFKMITMEEFALLFRRQKTPSDQEAQSQMSDWETWIEGIAAQGKFIPGGRLQNTGQVLHPGGVITDGPFVELKEELLGFIIVKAEHLHEATTLAHGCPILKSKGTVEIRPIIRGV
jgi:hypothetical protein